MTCSPWSPRTPGSRYASSAPQSGYWASYPYEVDAEIAAAEAAEDAAEDAWRRERRLLAG